MPQSKPSRPKAHKKHKKGASEKMPERPKKGLPPTRRKFLKVAGLASAVLPRTLAAAMGNNQRSVQSWLERVSLSASELSDLSSSDDCCGTCDGSNSTWFSVDSQDQSQWCWIAVAFSLANYYNPHFDLDSQCELYDAVNSRTDCCDYSANSLDDFVPCNEPGYPEDSIGYVNELGSWGYYTVCFSDIEDQIDAQQPVAVGIQYWGSCSKHVMVISGYGCDEFGDPTVDVEDPDSGSNPGEPFCNFADDWSADWISTYYTD